MFIKLRNIALILLAALTLTGCSNIDDEPVIKPYIEPTSEPLGEFAPYVPPPYAQLPRVGNEWVSQGEISYLVHRDGDGVDFDNIIPAEIQLMNGDVRIKPLLHPLYWAIDEITDEKIILTSPPSICPPHRFPDAETQLDSWDWFTDGTTIISMKSFEACPEQWYAASWGTSGVRFGRIYHQISAEIINPEAVQWWNFGPFNEAKAQVARIGNDLLVIRTFNWGVGPADKREFENHNDFANREEFCLDVQLDPQDGQTFDECMNQGIGRRWKQTTHAVDYPLPDNLVVTNPLMEKVFDGKTEVRTRMRRIPQQMGALMPLGLQIEHPRNSNKWYWLDHYAEDTLVEVEGDIKNAMIGFGLMTQTHMLRRELEKFNDIADALEATPFILRYYDEEVYGGRMQERLYDADPHEEHSPDDRGLLWRRVYKCSLEGGGDLLFWFDVGRFLPAR